MAKCCNKLSPSSLGAWRFGVGVQSGVVSLCELALLSFCSTSRQRQEAKRNGKRPNEPTARPNACAVQQAQSVADGYTERATTCRFISADVGDDREHLHNLDDAIIGVLARVAASILRLRSRLLQAKRAKLPSRTVSIRCAIKDADFRLAGRLNTLSPSPVVSANQLPCGGARAHDQTYPLGCPGPSPPAFV
ncbi:hypothetical protein IWX90DRAFT_34140 [Phyllosticta citrichinensis]|uniref:Uncharacterized protein n=1 Tax=Phyllosticta citrichinensis TaxID=1130410 RepID=A0ABR1Y890_9PEZI